MEAVLKGWIVFLSLAFHINTLQIKLAFAQHLEAAVLLI